MPNGVWCQINEHESVVDPVIVIAYVIIRNSEHICKAQERSDGGLYMASFSLAFN